MNTEPTPQYSVADDGPFRRARVRIYGHTEASALEAGRSLRREVAATLSDESTSYPPSYQGFDASAGRHYSVLIVGLGGNRAVDEARLERVIGQLSASR